MSLQRLFVIMALAAPAMLGAAQPATAQTPPIAQPDQPSPPRYGEGALTGRQASGSDARSAIIAM